MLNNLSISLGRKNFVCFFFVFSLILFSFLFSLFSLLISLTRVSCLVSYFFPLPSPLSPPSHLPIPSLPPPLHSPTSPPQGREKFLFSFDPNESSKRGTHSNRGYGDRATVCHSAFELVLILLLLFFFPFSFLFFFLFFLFSFSFSLLSYFCLTPLSFLLLLDKI